ncbi:unnamed protein product [Toxocara canis]|uniref:Amidinotransferase n=1 Tax=Toxocara canis TaxID=6265 RepID=A0A183V3L5_TOXCA|nr:unnamed protein product [Toxocara canis]
MTAYSQDALFNEMALKVAIAVLTLEQAKALPDMVFVCNSGLVLDDKVYLSRFRHKERTAEQKHYSEWFKEHGFKLFGEEYPDFFEGGGDACFSTYGTLWAGFGPRSSKSAYEYVKNLGKFDIVLCELTHPEFYHLDTCFAPVDEKCALWYPPAFQQSARDEILKRMPESIAVSEAEAKAFVCNAITVRRTVIAPIGVSQQTQDKLAERGFAVTEVDMSEFMKSGGACQCLVLKL